MSSLEEVLNQLKEQADPAQLDGMRRYGMATNNRLGVKVPEMRKIAKTIDQDHDLALALWETGVAEARIVAGMIADPLKLTEKQMDAWVKDIESWDVCDQLCMNLLEKSPYAHKKILEWSRRDEEFVRRAAYALIACLAWHDRQEGDDFFVSMLATIKKGSTDQRNFVKKAVSWALRNIGKRNIFLNHQAIRTAEEIAKIDSRSARWIATDALRELQSESIQARLSKT